MEIQIAQHDGIVIQNLTLDCNPFKVGDKIYIDVEGIKIDKFAVQSTSFVYMVDDITHTILEQWERESLYGTTLSSPLMPARVKTTTTTIVTVLKLSKNG